MNPKQPARKSASNPPSQEEQAQESQSELFPIVGMGASAGGLEAFTQLLSHLPTDTGMGFVLIQHLSPDQKSMLTEAAFTDNANACGGSQEWYGRRTKSYLCYSPQCDDDY
nr:chemotaxis protein CheB [Nostoc sp. TCL26-01]